MQDNKLVFTQGFIDTLQCAAARQRFYDQRVPGLLLEVMASGAKVFRLRRKINSKQQWATIGEYPATSLDEARDKATLLNAELVKGASFTEQRQQERNELTLQQLLDLYITQYAEGRVRIASEMNSAIRRWFQGQLNMRLSQVTSTDLQGVLNQLAANGKVHLTNKARNYIRAIINWGFKKHLCGVECRNAVQILDGFTVQSRTRFVQPSEFGPLISAIKDYPDDRSRDFLLLCLYTGARAGDVLAMRWDQIDLTLAVWTIPRTKNGDSLTIGLSDEAAKILRRRFKNRNTLPWVLPGGSPRHKTPSYNHLQEPQKAWKKILAAAGIENLQIHDLRRTAGSYMAMTGQNTAVIQKALGHRTIAAAQVYQRVSNDPLKKGMNTAIAAMRKYAEGV